MSSSILLEYTNSNIERIVKERYNYYQTEIKSLDISIDNHSVGWKRYPLVDNMDGTYFHLITKDYLNKEGYCCPTQFIKCDRVFDYNPMMAEEYADDKKRTICGLRILRLKTVRDMIVNNEGLLVWQREESHKKGLRTRIKILDEKNKYFIVFDKRSNGSIYYWTSYPVYSHTIERLKKEYNRAPERDKCISIIAKTRDATLFV